MALLTIPGGFWIPGHPPMSSVATPVHVSMLMSASADKTAMIFRVPKSGTLDKCEFRIGTVTTWPTNGVRVSFQNVSLTTGDPDGTQDQFRNIVSSPGSNAWIDSELGLMTSDGTDTGVKRTVTAGDLLCVVLEQVNTGDAWSINLSVGSAHTRSEPLIFDMECYADRFTAAAWGKASYPNLALKYDNGTYAPILGDTALPILTWTSQTFNNGSAVDERALLFQFPVQVTVDGAWVAVDLDGDMSVILYDGTTALETVAFDATVRLGTGPRVLFAPFPVRTLEALTDYRIAVRPDTSTSCIIYEFTAGSAAAMDAAAGGANFRGSNRVNAGAWTDTSTIRPLIGVHVSSVHAFGGRPTYQIGM